MKWVELIESRQRYSAAGARTFENCLDDALVLQPFSPRRIWFAIVTDALGHVIEFVRTKLLSASRQKSEHWHLRATRVRLTGAATSNVKSRELCRISSSHPVNPVNRV
jgi:hypothetical protein